MDLRSPWPACPVTNEAQLSAFDHGDEDPGRERAPTGREYAEGGDGDPAQHGAGMRLAEPGKRAAHQEKQGGNGGKGCKGVRARVGPGLDSASTNQVCRRNCTCSN